MNGRATHDGHDDRGAPSVASLARLSFAMWGGLVAWMVHLTVTMGLVGASCTHGLEWVMHATTAVTGVVAVAALAVGVRAVRAAGSADSTAWEVAGREAFMAWLGVLLSGIGLALIVFEGVPAFLVEPCA